MLRRIIMLLVTFLLATASAIPALADSYTASSASVERMLSAASMQYSPLPTLPQQISPSPLANNSPPPPPPAQNSTKNLKCSQNPAVCWDSRYGGSSKTPYCCNNKCVDLLSDDKNCGMCRNNCKFATGCCNGICANLAYDANNCGRCGNSCRNGSSCIYGMCSYA